MEDLMKLNEWAKQIEEANMGTKVTVVIANMGDPSRLKTKEEAKLISNIASDAKKLGAAGGVQTTTKKGETRISFAFKDLEDAKKFAKSMKGGAVATDVIIS